MATAPVPNEERRLWARAVVWVVAIYCSTPLVRPVANYLRDRNLLRLAVALTFTIAAVWILRILLRNRPGRREVLVLISFGLLYAIVLSSLPLPEERIHYLEYGLLAGLIYRALLHRRQHRFEAPEPGTGRWALMDLNPVLGAIGANTLLGWFDEGIQAVVPGRHYDLRDVMMNSLAGTIAVIAMVALRHARRLNEKPVNT